MTDYTFPASVPIVEETWWLDARTRSGGPSITGREQIVDSQLALWRASITIEATQDNRAQWAAIRDALLGRYNILLVGPKAINGYGITGPAAFGAGGFYGSGVAASPYDMTVGTGASAGVKQLAINIGDNEALDPGAWIGFNHATYGRRVYRIHTATAPSAGIVTATFEPALKEAVTTSQTVYAPPSALCRMRLASDDTGTIPFVRRELTTATVELVEEAI